MRKILIALFAFFFINNTALAKIVVDVFGVDEQTATRIKQMYASQVRKIEGDKIREINYKARNNYYSKKVQEIIQKKQKLLASIQNKYGFAFVEFHTIRYDDTEDPYTTIDIITKDEPYRLKFTNQDTTAIRSARVLETTTAKQLEKMDANPFIQQLDSPYVIERYNALYALYRLMQFPNAKKQILENGKDKLIKILYLKQPNNHDIAYAILKHVSQKNYTDTNFKEWKKWAANNV